MNKQLTEINLGLRTKKVPELRAGDIVKIHRKIKEGEKERIQVFEGIIIAIKGQQSSSPMITVRKVSYGIGVELVLPLFSPQIDKIELVKHAKVRRAKLYYIRNKSAKALGMKYQEISRVIKEDEPIIAEKPVQETPAEEATPETETSKE